MFGAVFSPGMLLAEMSSLEGISIWQVFLAHLFSGVVFAIIGLVIFVGALRVIVWMSPFPIVKEIEQDQNVALAVIIGSILIGMALIISAAIHG